MSAPTIIAGPAIVQLGSNTYYSEGDITVALKRNTWSPQTSIAGAIDTRLKSQMVEISFTPVGVLDTVAKYLPYAASQIGTLLFGSANTNCVIWTRAGQKITWENAAITKFPGFKASPLNALFTSALTITALGKNATAPTDAAAWNAITTASFTDATFDETLLLTPRYTAAWGSTSPYSAMEPEDGFQLDFTMEVEPKETANYGITDMLLKEVKVEAKFTPVNLTEAQIWTLLNLQGSSALLPGDSVSKDGHDLVISAGDVSFTLHKAGPTDGGTNYGLTKLRQGEVSFMCKKTWSSGVLDNLFTVAFSAGS